MDKQLCCCSKMFMLLGLYGITAFPYPFMTMYATSTTLMFMVLAMFGMAGCCYWKSKEQEKCQMTNFFMKLAKLFAFFVVVMDVYLFGIMMNLWGMMGADRFFGAFEGMGMFMYVFMAFFFFIHVWGFYKMVFKCKKEDCDTDKCA